MSLFNISPSLASKLASIVVHADELLGPDSHQVDLKALRSAVQDAEVDGWIASMTAAALAPVKRVGKEPSPLQTMDRGRPDVFAALAARDAVATAAYFPVEALGIDRKPKEPKS